MEPQIFRPSPPLQPYVHCIWYSYAPTLRLAGTSLPILNPEWVLNFSEHFAMEDEHGCPLLPEAGSWVGGIQTRARHTVAAGRHEMLGVLFKPWGLAWLLGEPADALTDGYQASALPLRASRVEQIALAPVPEKVRLLETELLRYVGKRRVPALLPDAVKLLHRQPMGDGAVSTVARQLGVSGKTLSQTFRRYIGLSPRTYLQLHTINRLLPDLASGVQPLTKLTYEHHFFDQAHFCRLFRQVTGLTPSAYRQGVAAGQVQAAYPNFLADAN